MKNKLIIAIAVLFLSGCSTIGGTSSSPSAVVKQYKALADKGDAAGMVKLYSSHAIKEKGEEKIKEGPTRFIEVMRETAAAKQPTTMFDVNETVKGDNATVNGHIGDETGKSSSGAPRMSFEMVKENGEWKIDQTG
jgi:hypothetical protein